MVAASDLYFHDTPATYTYEEVRQASLDYFEGDELAAEVFAGKYALRDLTGTFFERTPEDMHRRLAREFSRIEQKYPTPLSEQEIFQLLSTWKVVPQGSPMAGIGNPFQLQSLSNCWVGETEVLTKAGVKPIAEVKVGDEVVTHLGRYKRVAQVHRNARNGRSLFRLKCFRTPEVVVTDNHQLLSITQEALEWGDTPSWQTVSHLRKGDYVAVPNMLDGTPDYDVDVSDTKVPMSCVESADTIWYEKEVCPGTVTLTTCWDSNRNHVTCRKKCRPVSTCWRIDEDFALFLGLWYGDGCIFSADKVSNRLRGITFTFGSHERKLIDFVVSYGERLFGIPADVNDNSSIDGSTQVAFHSTFVAYAFLERFGRGAKGKRLWEHVFSWDSKKIESLIVGLVSSDGTVTKDGDVRVVLTNHALIRAVYHVARRCGLALGYSETEYAARLDFPKRSRLLAGALKTYEDDRLVRASEREEVGYHTKVIGDRLFVRIDAKTRSNREDPFVYTLGVEEDHSYAIEGLVSLNCFVIDPPLDSYGGILKADQEQAQIMKRRGGVGFDISKIRPRGQITTNAAKTTDGIGVFMNRFSNTCREVAQNGRRGALMLTISVHHPEIRTFVNIKRDKKKVTGANISIRLTDEFMEAVKNGEKVQLRFPVEKDVPHSSEEWVDANELWNEIIEAAWASAEPGLMFWDTVKRRSPADAYDVLGYGSLSTNPCGEIPLSPGDSCRLILMNPFKYVKDPFTSEATFDAKGFAQDAAKAQRLMDDLVDLELEVVDRILDKIEADPEPDEVKRVEYDLWKKVKLVGANGRRTGLGLTALGDTLASLGIQYGSDAAVQMTETIYREMALGAYRSTVAMAKERGPFPVFSHELEAKHEFIQQILSEDPKLRRDYLKYGRRNIALTTTSPAGSVSLLTQTTSGCEPVFLLSYKRRRKITEADDTARVDFTDALGDRWQEYTVYHHGLKQWMKVAHKTDFEESPYWGSTSRDIDWVKKVAMQAAAQKWVCHSISNTTNLPKETTVETVKEIYMQGWLSGCKGVTVYRDGCRDGVLIESSQKSEPPPSVERSVPKRPKELPCDIHRATVKGEAYLVLVGLHEGDPYEVFCGLSKHIEIPKKMRQGTLVKNGKVDGVATYNLKVPFGEDDELIFKDVAGLFESPVYGAFTRTISLALRHGVPLQYLVDQLRKDKFSDITSFSSVVARVLSRHYIPDGTKVLTQKGCPKCGSDNMAYQQGCATCMNCGDSKCS